MAKKKNAGANEAQSAGRKNEKSESIVGKHAGDKISKRKSRTGKNEQSAADGIADYFIHFCHEWGDLITNLKLQKLLYYSQAWSLALDDKPLFEEDFQAWIFGPVLVSQYNRFKKYGSNPIARDPGKVKLPRETRELLDEVMEVYGKYNAYYLSLLTHEDNAWRDARGGIPDDQPSEAIISKEEMKAYYRGLRDEKEK